MGYKNIVGMDISQDALDMAEARGIPRERLIRADLETDPIPGETDAILASDLLLYFSPEKLRAIMEKMYESLNEGGRLGIRWAAGNDEIKLKGDNWVFLASREFLVKRKRIAAC